MTLVLKNEEMKGLLSLAELIPAMAAAYRELGEGRAKNRPRIRIYSPTGQPGVSYWFNNLSGLVPGQKAMALMGCFFDPLSTLLLTLPVLYPTVQHLGVHPIWFGIVLVVLIETGLITPPVGLNLFVIRGIARGHTLAEVSLGALPYVVLLLLGLGLLVAFPGLALWLPQRLLR